MIINKLRTKQCRRYVQPSNEDEFEFSVSINRRDRKEFGIYRLSTSYLISDLQRLSLANLLVRAIIVCINLFVILNILDGFQQRVISLFEPTILQVINNPLHSTNAKLCLIYSVDGSSLYRDQ